MARYALRRLLAAVPLLWVTSVLCFLLVHLAPGGPLERFAPGMRPEDVARLRHELGLDISLSKQYMRWMGGVLRGDLGHSLVTREPVARMIGERLPATLELMGTALLLSLGMGVGLGIVAALRRGRAADHLIRVLSLVGLSVPVFWLAILAILLFSVSWHVLPAGGRNRIGAPFSLLDHLRYLVLPACVLAIVQLPMWCRHMRASLLENLGQDWMRAARARGLSGTQAVLRHGIRPALGPVVTLLGLQIPTLFTGAVITEQVFGWPGIGWLFFEGMGHFDYPPIMGILFIASVLVVVGNLAADLVNAVLDPRARLGERS